MRIPGLGGTDVRTLGRCSVEEFARDEMIVYAAALAYHFFFSVFPFLVFLVALLGFLDVPGLFDWLLDRARSVLPEAGAGVVDLAVRRIAGRRHGGLLSFGIVAAVWSASAGVRSAMRALNTAYDVREDRPFWKRYSLSVAYTLALALLLVLATGLALTGSSAMLWLAGRAGIAGPVATLWSWLRIPLAALLAMLAVAIVYRVAPNTRQRFRLATPGSVVAVVLWVLLSLAFQLYLSRFGHFSATYGVLGGVMVLMLYFFLSAAALLFGAELNAVVQSHAAGPSRGETR